MRSKITDIELVWPTLPKAYWSRSSLLALGRSYQVACVVAAAIDLELFNALNSKRLTAEAVARKLGCRTRGIRMLLNALVALRILKSRGATYWICPEIGSMLDTQSVDSIYPMLKHQANCMRNWAKLGESIAQGLPVNRAPYDQRNLNILRVYIDAMHCTYSLDSVNIVKAIPALRNADHILDVGSGTGTWAEAFLKISATAKATLVDIPPVIRLAKERLAASEHARRITFTALNFEKDELPHGADLAWVSAVIHQNSRRQNRQLFCKIWRALAPGGKVAIRDVVLDHAKGSPIFGVLFAMNMHVETQGGSTYTFQELRADLISSGFVRIVQARRSRGMDAIIVATKSRRPLK